MRVSSITIRNLRSIDELSLEFPYGLTALVGANSSGKSNILRAFELFFTGLIDRRQFQATYDMPSWIINNVAPSARTSVQVTRRFNYSYRRLCNRGVLPHEEEIVAFVSGHGSSQQATAFTILRSWSPLSKCGAIFDYDNAGRNDGASRLKNAVVKKDYFFLPNAGADIVLEDLYPAPIKAAAESSNSIAQKIIIEKRPDGTELSKTIEWNKDQLAQFFVKHASDADWQLIEDFVKEVVETTAQ